MGSPSGGIPDDDKDGRKAAIRACCPLLFGGGLSGNALLRGSAACHGRGAVLGCGRLCGGRHWGRASGGEISSVGCAFAARAVSFSDGGGLLFVGDFHVPVGVSGRHGAVSCFGRHFPRACFHTKRTFQRRRLSSGGVPLFAAVVKRGNLPSLLFFGMMRKGTYRIAYKAEFLLQ